MNDKREAALQDQVSTLRGVITDIDALSQEGFSQIKAIASLAALTIENGDIQAGQIDDIYQALRAIMHKAQEIENCINTEAENVGSSYTEDIAGRIRRFAISFQREQHIQQ